MLPLQINFLEIIDFFDLFELHLLVFVNLFLEDLQVIRRLGHFGVVLSSEELVLGLKALNLLVLLVRPDLIISNGLIGDSQFVLVILEVLLGLSKFLLKVLDSLLVAVAVIFEGIHARLLKVQVLFEHALPTIELLDGLDLLLLSLERVIRQRGILVEVLNDLVVVNNLLLLIVVLQKLQDVGLVVIGLLSNFQEVDHELGLSLQIDAGSHFFVIAFSQYIDESYRIKQKY